jgi:hypothetical protein
LKIPTVHYPWNETPIGGGFFVPTLTPDKTKTDGLRAAIYNNCRGVALTGIKNGMLGVYFKRKR